MTKGRRRKNKVLIKDFSRADGYGSDSVGLAVLVTYSFKNGMILLVIAFLVSSFGLPMLTARVLRLLQDANDMLRGFIRCG